MLVVKFLTRIAAFLLLVAWLPATALCAVNCSATSEADVCCPHPEESAPSAPEKGNCVFSSAVVKVDDQQGAPPALLVINSPPATVNVSEARIEAVVSQQSAPDRVIVSWQFLTRTAPLPRAPSIVS